MQWTIIDTWIVLDVLLVAISSTLVGVHLVLRKDSLLGDGISHAVLPGIALGYIITQSRESVVMYIGAITMGVLTAVLSEFISKHRKIDEGASLGVVFSGLFALGLLLINVASNRVDLDPSCVLFGAVELTPLDTMQIAGFNIPRAIVTNGSVLLINLLVMLIIYRKLNASVFDPLFAKTSGIQVIAMRYIHIILVAVTTITAFESVGSILIVALLVVPQAIALLLSNTMRGVILWSICITSLASVLGHISAVVVPSFFGLSDTNTVGSISVVLGVFFFIVLMCAPRGVIAKKWHIVINQIEIAKDDILKALYKSNMEKLDVISLKELVASSLISGRISTLSIYFAKMRLLSSKQIQFVDNKFTFTQLGKTQAQNLKSTHRLWEDYLYSEADVKAEQVHSQAEQLEHVRSLKVVSELSKLASPESSIPGHSHSKDSKQTKDTHS